MPGNPYLELIGQPDAASPADEPAAQAEAPEASNPYAEILQEEDEGKNALTRSLFEVAQTKSADAHAKVLELAKRSGAATDLVEQHLPEFERSAAAAAFDPAKWRKENPALAQALLERPELAPVVFGDEHLSGFTKAVRLLGNLWSQVEARRGFAPADAYGEGLQQQEFVQHPESIPKPPTMEELFPASKQVAQVRSPLADDTSALRPLKIFKDALQQNTKGLQVSQAGFEAMVAAGRGDADAEYQALKRATDLKRDLTERVYNAGPLEQLGVDVAKVLPSQGAGLAGAGVGGALGAGLGALPGLLLRDRQVAVAGAKLGFNLGRDAGAFGSSFAMEAGGNYVDLVDTRTDDGQPISKPVAVGASLLYGVVAAALEVDSLKTYLPQFGRLGDIAAGADAKAKKAALKELLRDSGFKAILADAGKRWVGAAAGEAKEEALQQLAQDVVDYFAKSASAGKLQEAHPTQTMEAMAESASGAFFGTLPQGAVHGAAVTTRALYAEATRQQDGHRVAAVAKLAANSPTARAAPDVVAQLVARETAAGGEPVTHLYVDAGAFTRLFQENGADPAEAAQELLGERGPQQLQEAVASGQKLEVPVATYLEKWGTKPAVAESLAGDTAARKGGKTVAEALLADTVARAGAQTAKEAEAQQAATEKSAQALAEQYLKENTPAESQAEQRLVDSVRAQLVASGVKDADAGRQVALTRALIRTQAARFGVSADELFGQYLVTVEKAGAKPAAAPAAAVAQGPVEDEAPAASKVLAERLATLTPEDRAREYYLDSVSGLRNRRAFDATERPAGKQVAIISSPDVKGINDDPQGGHDTANALLRAIGKVVGPADAEAARSGTNFIFHVQDQAELDALLAQVREALPDARLGVEGALAPNLDSAFTALDKGVAEKRAAGQLLERGKLAEGLDVGSLTFPEERAAGTVPEHLVQGLAQLSDEDYFRQAYLDPKMPGVLSREGWEGIPRKAHVASIDGRLIKAINEAAGKDKGDEVLHALAGEAMRAGGADVDFAHLSGDEFAAQHDSKEDLAAFLARLEAGVQDVRVYATLNGERRRIRVAFRSGIGEKTYGAADRALNAAKRAEGAAGADARGSGEVAAGVPDGRAGDGAGPAGEAAARAEPRLQRFPGARQEVARLSQGDEQGPGDTARGFVELARAGAQRIFRVVLNPKADLSTFLHETGHIILEMMGDLAERPDAPEQLKQDWASILGWVGVTERAGIGREHHEQVARGLEAYLLEGKAPSSALERPFRRFKLWLSRIYRSAASLNAPLNDEVRGVFDRLLASDAELERQRRAMGLGSLFRSPKDAGMTPEQYQAHLELQEKAASHAARVTEARALKDRLRETEGWWQEEEGKLREAAGAEYDARPDVRAWRYLREGVLSWASDDGVLRETGFAGPQKLDRDAVLAVLGTEEVPAALKSFVRGKREAPRGPRASSRTTAEAAEAGLAATLDAALGGEGEERGSHPDEVAELFGFPTGKALLEALQARPERGIWTKERAAEAMRERHPDVLQEREQLAEAAAQGLHGEATAEWYVRELRILRARSGQQGEPPVAAIRRAADLIVERSPVRSLNASRALQAERSAAEKASVAAAKGDWAQAYVFQQQRLLNLHLHRALTEAREEREAFLDLADNLADDKRRSKLGLGGKEYLDTVDGLLESLGLKEAADPTVVEKRLGMPELLTRMEAEGYAPAFDTRVLANLLAAPRLWKDLSVAEMRTATAALKQVKKAAYEANHVRVEGKAVQLDAVAGQIAEEASRLPDKGVAPLSDSAAPTFYDLKMWVHGFHAARRDPSALIRKIGPTATSVLWNGYLEARRREQEIARGALDAFLKMVDALPKEMHARRYERVDASSLPITEDVNLGGPWDRQTMWMLASHVGNDSNFDRLVGGYGWTKPQVMEFLNRNMTKEEWGFVQGLWDLNDKYIYPLVEETFERANGIKPRKIQATQVETPHGTLRGGYMPARYNPKASALGRKQAESALQRPLGVAAASVAKSFTKERAAVYSDVIDLNWSTVPGHLTETMRYVAFDSFIRDAAKVLKHGAVDGAIQRRMGEVYASALDSWLKAVAGARTDNAAKELRAIQQMLNLGKGILVVKAIGWNMANASGDLTGPLVAATAGKISAHRMAKTYALALGDVLSAAGGRVVGRPMVFSMREEAVSKSAEMQRRDDSMTKRLRKEVENIGKRGRKTRVQAAREAARETLFFFQETVAKLTEPVIWHAAYGDALEEGMGEAQAVAHADEMLRQSTASHEKTEQPSILRDQQMGAALVFHGYFNRLYNLSSDRVSAFQERWGELGLGGRAGGIAQTAGQVLALSAVAGALGSLFEMKAPKDDDDWVEWLALQAAAAGWAQFPFVGEAGMYLTQAAVAAAQGKPMKRDFSSRTMPGLAGGLALRDAALQVFQDGDGAEKALDVLEAFLIANNLPSGAPIRSARYVDAVVRGKRQPENAYEVLRGLMGAERVKRDR